MKPVLCRSPTGSHQRCGCLCNDETAFSHIQKQGARNFCTGRVGEQVNGAALLEHRDISFHDLLGCPADHLNTGEITFMNGSIK